MKQKDKKISQKIIFLLFSTFFLVGLFTFKDYGISVDEEFNRISGLYWLNYILSFTSFDELKNVVGVKLNEINDFTLGPALEVVANHSYYGVVFDLPLAFIEVIFKINDSQQYFYLRHLLTFILFLRSVSSGYIKTKPKIFGFDTVILFILSRTLFTPIVILGSLDVGYDF